VRRRLVAAIAAVAATAVLLFALPLAIVLGRTFRDEELLRLQRDTVAATRSIDTVGRRKDPIELPQGGDRLTVYDSVGARLAGAGPKSATAFVSEAIEDGRLVTESSGGQLAVAVPLLTGERVTGALLAVRDDAAVDRRERDAFLAMAALALGVVALAVGAALLTARRLARPLERIASAAANLDRRKELEQIGPTGIGELDAVTTALSDSARRLEETLARERAFSADASHQLRTPLAALRLELESIELEADPPPQVDSALQEVDRLQGTIDTLLAVVRDVPRGDRRAGLVKIADRAQRSWHTRLAASGRPIRVRAIAGEIVAAAEPGVVEQILDVLIENAGRHGDGAVTIGVRAEGDWTAIDVSDEGPGFGPDPEAAFSRRRRSAGHGIGLSLARSLAAAEGGSLRVSDPGPGPTLTLLLPPAR
jgi:signal transduction histidine kinase